MPGFIGWVKLVVFKWVKMGEEVKNDPRKLRFFEFMHKFRHKFDSLASMTNAFQHVDSVTIV